MIHRPRSALLILVLASGCALDTSVAGGESSLIRSGFPSVPLEPLEAQPDPPEPPGPPPYTPDPDDPDACSEATYMRLWDPDVTSVEIDCNLRLPPGFTTTTQMVIPGRADGITIECNGARFDGSWGTPNAGDDMIEIRSTWLAGYTYDPPEDVTIRGCEIHGSVRIFGMAESGNSRSDPNLRSSSRAGDGPAHTARARAAAPRRVTLDDLEIIGTGRIPLYLAPGVTEITLERSEVAGRGKLAIYLDAESAYNTLRHNTIHSVGERELVAVDGSSHNHIVDNYFSALHHGGIFLYRNCGEGGTIRVTPPTHNYIVNNVFYYRDYVGSDPAIYLGARAGTRPASNSSAWARTATTRTATATGAARATTTTRPTTW